MVLTTPARYWSAPAARETASRVALGEVAKQFLDQAFGIRTVAHVVALGGVQTNPDLPLPTPDDLEALDASPVRTLDKRPKPASSNASTRPRRPPIRWAA